MINPGLEGRTAIVTGSNSPLGIGAGIARSLAAQGVRIALVFWPTPQPASGASAVDEAAEPGEELYAAATASDGAEVLAELRASGAQAEIITADLADPTACREVFDRVEAALGPVEILVNNAAYCTVDSFVPDSGPLFYFESTTVDETSLDRHFAVNTRGPAILMAEFYRRHLAREASWGRVVNISTDAAPQFPGEVSYGASKYALESLSRSAAQEMAPAGVTVNIVSPGPIQTGWINAEMQPTVNALSPFGRTGEPEDIADVVVFLASEQARWLSGQILYVGGGKRTY
ncbi:SDR family NAD(P)-dependent oxidoreductase [Actinoalloteichus hymeniacidonis]|uniref:3-oxoacyl-[acyl-carrier-protein] reductase n=1 Tax=Actinoalloteichus hymeniacidonis TaxID=340345 RepID=A0AAC9HST1_9PSEU|nr:SDR family oxidoreductase [Actinoalloteichus hymeniacidonis]AOS64674.1 dehydrogenase of unknown specificity, short-chain alcohol dehydrogenase like [Actinoalloteichus hymeniacidonis]MBB5907251.1 3-oxoacyl-[acyl-carrier protein] reductase [Actinoalloteichus hymeniacidonis]